MRKFLLIHIFLIAFPFILINANQHPCIFLTPKAVKEIKASLGKYPTFDKSYYELKAIADKALTEPIIVPIPHDGGGGYTHEKHKNNYYQMNACGILYQITGKKEYAEFVKNMLLKYAEIYPGLGMHPMTISNVRGKLFWQSLNDAVWLFHTSNAYDCVYNYISKSDRQKIENQLLLPEAEFLSNGNAANYETFNKMHNHGTWSQSAVGMTGFVLNNKDLIDRALYGSKKDGKTGFISQLNVLFSPDGYFTEGPYYQRYSIWPFMTFAQVIQNNKPELKIFEYRDSILLKAVNTLIQCSYNGEIFYMNDALQKTFKTQEIVYAVDIAYKNNPSNKQLLDIANQQQSFTVTGEGLATAKALKKQKVIDSFKYKSSLFRDGEKGENGGIAILRTGEGDKQTCLTLKATSHGLSHGHYDKLTIALYDNGHSILSDYGAARFLNIEPKSGGGYTTENHSWAQQTIAHNTVTVDQTSDFQGNFNLSSKHHSDIQYFDNENPKIQVISASENNAYKNVKMQRTTALIKVDELEFPVILDLFRLKSDSLHIYDYPFYYQGQMVSTNFDYTKVTSTMKAMGSNFGYQHLWLEATAKSTKPTADFTWYNENRFYSITTTTDKNTDIFLTRLGANDPDFNLRNEAGIMFRQNNASNHTFATVIEPHGLYDLNREITSGFTSNIENIEIIFDNDEFTAMKITSVNAKKYLFVTVNKDFDKNKTRKILLSNYPVSFTGNYYFKEI